MGNMVFVSGQLPIHAETGIMPEGISEQAKASLTNIKNILAEADLSMNDVVKTTIFLDNMADFTAVNEVYGNFFEEPYPSRSTVEVAKLPKDAKVEIEAIAFKN